MGELFCTVGDLEAFLQVEIAAELTESANRAIAEATAMVRNYCRQYLSLVEDETLVVDGVGGTRLFLPQLPVISVAEVVEDDETLTATDDYKLGQWGILHRMGGSEWATGIQNIEVVYSHGYEEIPDDVASIATRVAARAFQAGLRAADVEGVPGVMSKHLGDYTVAFGSEHAGGSSGESVLGASAAPVLLRSEKAMLDGYRVKRL